jgi:LCP family protein required for cell wall assembly
MKRPQHSIDGFIPRRPAANQGERQVGRGSIPLPKTSSTTKLRSPDRVRGGEAGYGLTHTIVPPPSEDIDISKNQRISKRRLNKKSPRTRRQRILRWIIIAFVLLFLSIVGWIAYRTVSAGGSIFKGNLLGLIQSQPLKQDANGRSNILILGTSEDDPGHGGAYLTDSMMIMSIDQNGKTVDMVSVPRDLYVKYGMACNSGYEGKINEYFNCVNSDTTSQSAEQDRLIKTKNFVGKIFGVDIQYAVHVNNTVMKEAVDAVGGIDVNIQGDGPVPYGVSPGSVLDRNFDWRCKYACNLVKYSPGVHSLDGQHALFLAMARGDTAPTYGFINSNFDREKNQQKIIIALKQKAVSTGTLTDVAKVTKLIDALGNNLRTNFDTTEIRTLMQLGTDIKTENIKTISLYDGSTAVVTTGTYYGASVVMPSDGIFNYASLRAFIRKNLSSNPITRENAVVDVLNGSSTAGVAQTEATKLTTDGFTIGNVANAPAGTYGNVEIYQIGTGNPATKAKLESLYNVKVKTSTPPTANNDTKFVVIIGKARSAN